MKSRLPKVLHKISGQSLIECVLGVSDAVSPDSVTLVVGHQAELVRIYLGRRDNLAFVVQEPQLGTAHALQQAEPVLSGRTGTVLMLSGDVPLLRPSTLRGLLETHREKKAAATVLTAMVERPHGYGRIVREDGEIARIVEERDASPAEKTIREINSGIYAFDLPPLFEALRGIASNNAQGEFYLTELVAIYRRRQLTVSTCLVAEAGEIRGINSRQELAEAGMVVRQRKNEELMAAGVTLVDPATTYIDASVEIGADTIIQPGVVIEGQTTIGSACEVQAHVRITDSVIGDRVTIKNFCVIASTRIASGAAVGPFAHLRPDTVIGENARVGNFVELKKTTLGAGSKANHLSYLGDATIGAHVNVGAGTITCNYDGVTKSQTVIEDGAFIGSDTQLVAPVTIGSGAYVAAGSSIVEDVPAGALGIARARQSNLDGWVERKNRS
jgi:bifunctional UDP-N-acetylglucosamine pyrophosphorylase/glucosamine-1-phosphate N-acetyltransferase